MWALVLMLLPASLLLLAVIVLPFVMGQRHVVLYTVGVFLLGVTLHAVLQLMRRCRVVRFEPTEALAADRWRPESLAVALVACPAFCAALALNAFTRLDAVLSAAAAATAALIIAGGLTFAVVVALRRETLVNAAVAAGAAAAGAAAAAADGPTGGLTSIPEANANAEPRLMQAFLRDSIVNVESLSSLQQQSEASEGTSPAASEDGSAAGAAERVGLLSAYRGETGSPNGVRRETPR